MDSHRRKRLQLLINTRFKGNRVDFQTATGLSKGRISQLLDGKLPFGERAAEALCKKLELPDRWFEQGASDVSPAEVGTRSIPVISEVQAGNFRDIVDAFAVGDGEDSILTDLVGAPYAFALRIEGRSMLPEFNEGDRVIIDPGLRPRSGDYVVARNGKGGATFKKYRVRGTDDSGREVFELIPLNTDEFNSVRSDVEPLEVIGTMVEHRRYRKSR